MNRREAIRLKYVHPTCDDEVQAPRCQAIHKADTMKWGTLKRCLAQTYSWYHGFGFCRSHSDKVTRWASRQRFEDQGTDVPPASTRA